jgi:hypothetical protein
MQAIRSRIVNMYYCYFLLLKCEHVQNHKMSPKCGIKKHRLIKSLVSSSTTLHVFLEGLTLRDGLSWVIGDDRGWVTGVGLTSHGPSHLLGDGSVSRLWVWVDTSVNGGDKSWLGSRGKGRSRCDEGKDDGRLGL